MLTTAFHTGFLGDLPVADAVRTILDHGYDQAELNAEALPWTGPHVTPETSAEDRKALARLGPFAALSAHHADYGHADPARNEASIAHTRGLIDLASDLGIAIVHVIPGDGADLDGLARALERNLRDAEARSIAFALEPIVNRVVGTRETALEILRRVPGVAINFDPSHLQVMDGSVTQAVEDLGPSAVHVHLKDAAGTPDDFAFVELGTGAIDLDDVMARLLRQGYRGAVSIEHESHYFADDVRPRDVVLRECHAFLQDLLKRASGPG